MEWGHTFTLWILTVCTLSPATSHPPWPFSAPVSGNHCTILYFVRSAFSDCINEGDHTMFFWVWLTQHSRCHKCQNFILFQWMNSSHCVYVCHIVFSHSSTDGHLGWLPSVQYCKWCCCRYRSTCILLMGSLSLDMHPVWDC